jgi:hypothetical protein
MWLLSKVPEWRSLRYINRFPLSLFRRLRRPGMSHHGPEAMDIPWHSLDYTAKHQLHPSTSVRSSVHTITRPIAWPDIPRSDHTHHTDPHTLYPHLDWASYSRPCCPAWPHCSPVLAHPVLACMPAASNTKAQRWLRRRDPTKRRCLSRRWCPSAASPVECIQLEAK